jgi:hypothetical protein
MIMNNTEWPSSDWRRGSNGIRELWFVWSRRRSLTRAPTNLGDGDHAVATFVSAPAQVIFDIEVSQLAHNKRQIARILC